MSINSITDATAALFNLLEPFTADERLKIVNATMILLGEKPISLTQQDSSERNPLEIGEASEYFASKQPKTKTEELAVAARYRELKEHAVSSNKADLEAVFSAARINFDSDRFKDNIVNAMKSACLFNIGGTKASGYTLSLYGQNYVDALPDRDAVKTLQKPKPTKSRKPRTDKSGKT